MRRTLKIATYLLFVSVVSAIGIWFCKSDFCTPIHNYLFQFQFFLIFRGNREFIVNLLMGILTSAIFGSLGFFIDYFEKKRQRQYELFCLYRTVRNRCFERLFYEQNSYDKDTREVSALCDYIHNNLELTLDYRPPVLLLKVKIFRIFHKTTEDNKKPSSSSFSKDSWMFGKYTSEDKYALICSLISDLYKYFGFINMNQLSINESKHIISLCEKKLEYPRDPSVNYFQYEYFLKNAKKHLLVFERRLVSRYPYNTKEYQQFVSKKELFSKFYAIDNQFSSIYSDHGAALLLPEDCIVEDISVLYSATDECIKL